MTALGLHLNLSKHNFGRLILDKPWGFYVSGADFSPLLSVVPAGSTAELQPCMEPLGKEGRAPCLLFACDFHDSLQETEL